uniref:EF-hand domain-containing protein n=1 Tax=uncultured haloarchaeon TaxID=160804 RepID=A0A0K1YAZ8_9EURY|nr:hypothetical protein [uncultured haloarchaeon]
MFSGDDGTVTTFRANATGTGDTTFQANIPGTSFSDTATITSTGTADGLTIEANQSTVTAGDKVQINLSIVDTGDRVVPVSLDLSVDTTLGTLDSSDATTTVSTTDGEANVTLNATEAGTASVSVANSGLQTSVSTSITIEEEQDQPDEVTSEVNFNDNAAADGATSLTVDNATHDADFVIVAHTATDSDGDGDIQFNNANGNKEIGTKIGSSAIQSNGTQSNIEVNLSKNVSDGDNIDSLAADDDQQIVMMLHVANESGDTNFGGNVKEADGETPVFDNNFVNVSSLDGAAGNADSDGDGEIDRTEVQTAITDFVVEETLTQQEAQDVIRAFIV